MESDFAILWTNLFDFYRRMGFELTGREIAVDLNQDLPQLKALSYIDSNQISPESILRLYQQHSVHSFRTVEEIKSCLKIPESRICTAWDSSGKMVAYAVEGKGADLGGYVHEWGGSVSALMSVLQHMRKLQNRNLTLIAPEHSKNLIDQLKRSGCVVHPGHLGMIKVLNLNSIAQKVRRAARSVGSTNFRFETEEQQRLVFGCGKNEYVAQSDSDLVKLLFGPEKPSMLHSFDSETRAILDQILPIPIWVWGWDSV